MLPDSQALIEFVKRNLFFLVLVLAGLMFLGIGLIQLFENNPTNSEFKSEQEIRAAVTEAPSMMVDVAGAVLNPGVYKLTSDSRIQDALVAAGGLAANADREYVDRTINLAQKLSDGMKVYVPTEGETPVQTTQDNSMSINTASLSDLDRLPGVGPATAQKIVDNRPYASLEELTSKRVVSQTEFEKIKDQIHL